MSVSIRPNIAAMRPYSPGRPIDDVRRELGLTDIVKLASNENPLGPSPKAVAAIQKAAAEVNFYPDANAYDLRKALGEHYGFPMEQIAVGNGSDNLITLLGSALLGSTDDEVIVGTPSFTRYDAAAHRAPCVLHQVPLDARYCFDLDAMARLVSPKTKLIFLANPNNPTGTIIPRSDLEAFLAQVHPACLVVLDEAYFEFAQGELEYPDGLDLLRAGHNVCVMRTFSKAYGLAGLRVGYMITSPEIVDAINRCREPFNVNAIAQAGAIAALGDTEFLERTIRHNTQARKRVEEAMLRCGVKPIPSHANFVLGEVGSPAEPIFNALLNHGVIIRGGHVLGVPNAIRVSVGTDRENERFELALSEVMAKVGVPT